MVDFFIFGFQSHSSPLVVIFDLLLILAMLALSLAIYYDFVDSRVLIIIIFVRALLTLQIEIFSSKKLATAYLSSKLNSLRGKHFSRPIKMGCSKKQIISPSIFEAIYILTPVDSKKGLKMIWLAIKVLYHIGWHHQLVL